MSSFFYKVLIPILGFNVFSNLYADLNFDNYNANLTLKASRSQLRINKASKVTGWSGRSIVKDSGHNASNLWIEGFSDGAVISQSGGTIIPQTNLIEANSNAIASGLSGGGGSSVLERTTSNALLFGLRNVSNSLLFLDRTDSAAKLFLTRNNSNTLLALNRAQSNSLVTLSRTVRTNSNATAFALKNISNTLSTVVNINNTNSLAAKLRYVSNSLLLLDRTDSAAKLFLTRNNSNTLLALNRAQSNSLVTLSRTVRTNSNATAFALKNISNSLLTVVNVNNTNSLAAKLRYVSNSLLLLDRTDSAAKLFLTRNNSNALLALNRANSNALLKIGSSAGQAVVNNSNAIILLNRVVRTNSNASAFGIRNNSNTSLFLERTDSAAKLFLVRNVSNALLAINRTSSAALIELTLNNSSAIILLDRKTRTNSNAFAFGLKNLSQAQIYLNRTASNALAYGLRNLSKTTLFLNKNTSNTILFNNRTTSNALAYGLRNLSKTTLFLNKNTSNTIVFNNRNTSNTLLYLTKNNSNSIAFINNEVQTIFGPTTLTVNASTYSLLYDIFLSGFHIMSIIPPGSTCIIDGGGHSIHLASNLSSILQIADGVTVEFRNVVFKNYYESAIAFGVDSKIVCGDGVRIELNIPQEWQQHMTFVGDAILNGFSNKLEVGGNTIEVLPHSTLYLQDVILGLKANNIVCDDSTSLLVLDDCRLYLNSDFSFTSGSMLFKNDILLTGTNIFSYQSSSPSTIDLLSRFEIVGSTFDYQPLTDNRDLLVMTNETSILHLNNCSLSSSTTGMRLAKGELLVDGKCSLINDGAVASSEGFSIGNGVSDDDATITINPGASLNLVSGILDYQNVN